MKKLALFFIPIISISLLASCGPKAKTYHVKFTNGNEIVKEEDYKENEVIVAPKNPEPYEKDHKTYTFDAWYDGDIKFVEGTKATKDVEYVAQFNGVDIKYTVTFMNEGQEYKKITDAKYGDEIIAPETNPTKDTDKKYEYTFNKWIYKDTGKDFITGDKVEGNTIIVADYNKKAIKYDVTFKKGTEIVDTKEFNADNLSVTAPTFSPTAHYTGIWSATGEHASEKTADSGETITFTEDELDNWEFTYVESAISYSIKFEKDGEVVETITKKITDSSLSFTSPEFSSTTHYDGEWYCAEWGDSGKSLGSKEECTLTAQNLDNYTFVYKETLTNYTITFQKAGEQDETRTVNLNTLSFTAPTFSSTTHYDGKWYCADLGTGGKSLGSGETCSDLTSDNLGNYTFVYQEEAHKYSVTFKKTGESDQVKHITVLDDNVTAPTFTAADYRTGKWVSANPAKELGNGETSTLDLHDWTFNYSENDIDYTITFKKTDGQDETRTVNLTNPSFTTPKFENVPTHYTGWWVCDGWPDGSTVKLGSETPCTLDKDANELGNHTFVYTEEATQYDVVFGSGDDYKGTKQISINSKTITAPEHDISEHYDSGVWKEGDIEIASGDEYTFTEDQLGEHTFTWTQTPRQYQVTFNYADGTTESVIDYISVSDLTITAPKTQGTPQVGYRYVWKTSDDLIIESEGSKEFTESELKEYIFMETEVENIYTITYVLGDTSATNPGNPTSYKVTDDIILSAPTLEEFTFKGWYLSEDEHNKFQYQNGWAAGQMTGNLTLYADWHITDKTLNNYSWQEISDISDSDEASKYFDVGETKTVSVNSTDQQVRIIDFNYDVDANDNKIGITFEFANILSDENGYSLATYWMNTNTTDGSNSDYCNSSVRKALTGEGNGDLNWFQYFGTEHDNDTNKHFSQAYSSKTVLDMLPDDLTKEGILKTVKKSVNIKSDTAWVPTDFTDKLFLLTPNELKEQVDYAEQSDAYLYYNNATSSDNLNSRRRRQQVKKNTGARQKYLEGTNLDGAYVGKKYSSAGLNKYNAIFTYSGGPLWLRSPYTLNTSNACAVDSYGSLISDVAYDSAFGVAPAFCI